MAWKTIFWDMYTWMSVLFITINLIGVLKETKTLLIFMEAIGDTTRSPVWPAPWTNILHMWTWSTLRKYNFCVEEADWPLCQIFKTFSPITVQKTMIFVLPIHGTIMLFSGLIQGIFSERFRWSKIENTTRKDLWIKHCSGGLLVSSGLLCRWCDWWSCEY